MLSKNGKNQKKITKKLQKMSDDFIEFAKLYYFVGQRSFPINTPNTISGSGKVFYHFLNDGEVDNEKVNPFLARFKVDEEKVHNYSKTELNQLILQFEYIPHDLAIIGSYSRSLFSMLKCKCVYKSKFEFINNDTTYYAIMIIDLKQKGKTSNLQLYVHVYLDESIRDEKYLLSNNIFKNQFE